MKTKTIDLKSTSALKLSEYRKFAKRWKPDQQLSNIFNRLSKGKSKYRLYVSPTKGVIELTTRIPAFIDKHVKEKGYHIDQLGYIRGYVTDKHGRQVKLGKVLSDNAGYLDMFVKHENRKRDLQILEREDYVLAISHHAYDIIGASTDRGWSSCTDLRGNYAVTAPTKIQPEVDNRSIIAYLVRKEDTNIQRPVARALAKRFISDAGSERYLVDAIYPNEHPLLLKKFQAWLDRNINKHLPKVPHDYTLFSLPIGQYVDGHSHTDEEGNSKEARGSFLENMFRRTPNAIPAKQNLLSFIYKFHSNFSALDSIKKDETYRTRLIATVMKHRLALSRTENESNRLKKLEYIDKFLANIIESMYEGRYPLTIATFMQKAGKSVAYVERSDEEFERIYRHVEDKGDEDNFFNEEPTTSKYVQPKAYPTDTSALSYIQNGFKVFYGKGRYPQKVDSLIVLRDLYEGLENKGEVLSSYFDKMSEEAHRDLLFVAIKDWFNYVPWQQVYKRLARSATLHSTLVIRGNIDTNSYYSNKLVPIEILMAMSLLRIVDIREFPTDIPTYCKIIERIEIMLENGFIQFFNDNYLYRVKAGIARDRNYLKEDVALLSETIERCPNISKAFILDDDEY